MVQENTFDMKLNLTFVGSIVLHFIFLLFLPYIDFLETPKPVQRKTIQLSMVTLNKVKEVPPEAPKVVEAVQPVAAVAPVAPIAEAPKLEKPKDIFVKSKKELAGDKSVKKIAQGPKPLPISNSTPEAPKAPVKKFDFAKQVKGILSDKGFDRPIPRGVANGPREVPSLSNRESSSMDSKELAYAKTSPQSKKGGIFGPGEGKSYDTSASVRGAVKKEGYSIEAIHGKTVILGSIDPEIVQKILRKYLPNFSYCYEDEVGRRREKISGLATLEFTIGPAGNIIQGGVNSKTMDFSDEGENCIRNVLRTIQFPRPKGESKVMIRQPLNFTT